MGANRIWVLGSANRDVTLRVERLPREGETVLVTGRSVALGGKGSNVAAVCARAGAPVSFLGCVGRDEAGDSTRREMERIGVDVRHLAQDGAPSGQAYIMVGASGNNAILVEPGANQRVPLTLKPEFAPGDLFIAQYETNGVAHYIKMAREGGLRTLLNPSPFRADSEAIALADYVIVNAVELSQLVSEGAAATGRAAAGSAATDSAAAAAVAASASRQLGCTVIATLGRQGAVLAAGGDAWAAPGYAVHAADTQGAGDTFIGFFAASLLRGLAPPRAMLRAVIAASMSVRMRGSAQRSFPDLGEVDSEFGRLLKAGKPTNLWNRGNGNEK